MTDATPRPLDVPPAFIRLNEVNQGWLRGLPDLIDRLARRWSLTVGAHFPEIEYNYVAPAARTDPVGRVTPCVLKLNRRLAEAANEIAALRLWDGNGAARVIEADLDLGALLIERVQPGTMLVEVAEADDDAATIITANLLRQLWQPVGESGEPDNLHGLRLLESWCAAFDRNRQALSRGVDGFPAELFLRADTMRRDLLASSPAPMTLHGDMHHFNVLRGAQGRWLAINPKGLAGDPCFDVCQFMRNPRDRTTPALIRRRLDIFASELGLDRQRMKEWCLVHTMLDACWDFEGAAVRENGGAFSQKTNGPASASWRRDRSWQRAVARAEAALTY